MRYYYKDDGQSKPLETMAECHRNGIPRVFISLNASTVV